MTKVVNISDRGTLTLPKELRQRLGVKGSGQVIVEETENGLLIRGGTALPIEIYSDARIAEFNRNNEEALGRYGF
jgi:AbrB family looped-hinge helix DNA binding protein